MKVTDPTAEIERQLLAEGASCVAGIDEVGRGAWAGPVSVGVVVVDLDSLLALPPGVRDSKMLSPATRDRLFDPLCHAVLAYSIGHSSADECDRLGMTAALRLATTRALGELPTAPDRMILDGLHNYTGLDGVVNIVGADRLAVSVAAASVLAKVTRDRLMVAEAERFPGFCFESNKGYPSPEHQRALGSRGLTAIHRRSWSFAAKFGG